MLVPKAPIEKFIEYGFRECKRPYKDCYYLCVNCNSKMLFVSPVMFGINDWEPDDPRIHSDPNCRYRDRRTAEEILVDLVEKGMVSYLDI